MLLRWTVERSPQVCNEFDLEAFVADRVPEPKSGLRNDKNYGLEDVSQHHPYSNSHASARQRAYGSSNRRAHQHAGQGGAADDDSPLLATVAMAVLPYITPS